MIEGHGNDIYKFKDKITADFSSNVVSGGILPELKKHLINNIQVISNYPEPDAKSLQEKLAIHHKLDLNTILVTNGSTEAFYLIAQLFHSKKSTIAIPSFSEYEDACKINKHSFVFFPNQKIKPDASFETNLVWIGNPNNPDGKIIPIETIKELSETNPNTYFIIDEAYAELSTNHQSCIHLVNDYHNIIVTRSLTKCFAVPGIRLGYLVSNTDIQNKLMSMKAPWSVNSIALEAGNFILQHYTELLPNSEKLILQSKTLQKELAEIKKLKVFETDCNYFLVKLNKGDSSCLKKYLINNYGLLIRDATNFKGLDNSYFRIAVQDDKNNKLLIEGIKKWLLTI